MKSSSQTRLSQPPQTVSTTTSATTKVPRDWLDKVHKEQIFEILNTEAPKDVGKRESKANSMFKQFNNGASHKAKLPPRLSSQGSSRSSV